MARIFIDGHSGTTALRIHALRRDRLDLKLIAPTEDHRQDAAAVPALLTLTDPALRRLDGGRGGGPPRPTPGEDVPASTPLSSLAGAVGIRRGRGEGQGLVLLGWIADAVGVEANVIPITPERLMEAMRR